MKNIRDYHAKKYDSKDYEMIEPGIYQTFEKIKKGQNLTFLNDEKLISELKHLKDWQKFSEEDGYTVDYNGVTYYKMKDHFSKEENYDFFKDVDPKKIYVTSLMFEQEPEYGENGPDSEQISQYPLETLLDKFSCWCVDFYDEENKNDKVNSYMEFGSYDLSHLQNLRTIIGKHVYEKQEGEYIKTFYE